jgi:hypothetical protein
VPWWRGKKIDRRKIGLLDAGEMVKRLNQKLGGWANYFNVGPVTPAYRFIDDTPQPGFAGGSARSINSLAGASSTTLMSISTSSLDSSDCLCFRKTFRGRKHEVLSESRMR